MSWKKIRLPLVVALFHLVAHSALCLAPPDADDWDTLDLPTKQQVLEERPEHIAQKITPEQEQQPDSSALHEAPMRSRSWRERLIPLLMGGFLISSLLVAFVGARSNAKITIAFEDQFCKEPEGTLWKQFTRLGKGPGKLLTNESPSTFKLHANGHRHLEGAVITLTLLRRHEMMSYAMQLASKQEDVVCLELYVKEAVMPLMVLAIAARATHKELLRTSEDIKQLAPKLEVKEDRIKDWPSDLLVYAEHPSYFYDMMTKPMMAQVFGLVAFQKQRPYFRGLHITSNSENSHSQVIRFWFAVPKAEKMDDLSTLMTAVFAMVNQVGSYSISAERQKQAEQARQDFAKRSGKKELSAFAKEAAENRKQKKRR